MLVLYFAFSYIVVLKLEKTIRGYNRSETDIKVSPGVMVWTRVTDNS